MSLEHMPSHAVAMDFPFTMDELNVFDVIIFSDIGANSFLLHPDVFLRGKTTPNRLRLMKDWVEAGGGFAMCGGYMSFSGFGGAAKYYRTPIEEILPVSIQTFDDRVETPEGAVARVIESRHPIVSASSGTVAIIAWLSGFGIEEKSYVSRGHCRRPSSFGRMGVWQGEDGCMGVGHRS